MTRPVKRNLKKFEPPLGKVLHGAGQSPEQFRRYWDAVEEHKPLIYMMHIRINEIKEKLQTKIDFMNSINKDLIPQIGLNLKVKHEGQKCPEISKGNYDKGLLFLIKTLNGLDKPVFLRIGYEFNNPHHNYNPKEFIDAWKHIVDFFRKEKCDNVAFVWCACTAFNSLDKKLPSLMEYYPGDAYVDWFGDDLFGVQFFKDSRDKVVESFVKESEKHGKPLMIGESSPARVGVENGKESWKVWFAPYFEWIKNHPIVKAFCYINWDWGKDWNKPEWLNGRIEENEEVRKRYVKEISKPRYIHINSKTKI